MKRQQSSRWTSTRQAFAFLFPALLSGGAVAGEPAAERTIYGELDGILIQSALPEEVRLVESLTTPRGGGGDVSGFCTEPLCTMQTVYQDPVLGNGVLLMWKETSAQTSVRVLADGREVCRVPGLPSDKLPGYNLCLASNLPLSCVPQSEDDPSCPSIPACNLEFRAVNVRSFEIIGSTGSVGEACQEVVGGPPMANGAQFCCRVVETSTSCASILTEHFDCDALADYPDGDIIVTGGSDGPPSTFYEIQIDDDGALRRLRLEQGKNISSILCWERSLGVSTKGTHEVNIYGYVNREDAANAFWLNQQTGDSYSGVVGTFLRSEAHTVTTTVGRPKAPRGLLVRQTAYGTGAAGAILATWHYAEVPYAKVNVYLDNLSGSPVRVITGGVENHAAASLALGKHTVGVQGDDGAAGGKSLISQAAITLLSASPHPKPVSGAISCTWSAANGGSTTASWTRADPSDLVDVYLAGSPPIYQLTVSGSSTSATVRGTVSSDALSLQFLKLVDGQYYGSPLLTCSTGTAKRFIRGFCNGGDGDAQDLDITTAIFGLHYLFTGGRAPPCQEACDTNKDGTFDITDVVFVLSFLFTGGRAPVGWVDLNADGKLDPTCEAAQPGDDCQNSHGPCR